MSVPVSVRLLHAAGRGRALPGRFSGELLPGRLSSGGLTSGLLGTSHVSPESQRNNKVRRRRREPSAGALTSGDQEGAAFQRQGRRQV